MEIIEYKQEGKSKNRLCEDELVITENFVAVIDGVTSKSNFQYEGRSTGRLAADFVKEVLMETAAETGITEIIAACNRRWRKFYSQTHFPYNKAAMGPQAAAVLYSAYYRTIWLIGDCQAMVDGQLYVTPKKSDEILSELRSLVLHLSEDSGGARRLIEPWILKATIFANAADPIYGYAVINGEEIPEGLIQTIQLDEEACEIVLASDGYPVLMPTLDESEQELARILKEDPDCCRLYRSTKGLNPENTSFDDRTYIKFKI